MLQIILVLIQVFYGAIVPKKIFYYLFKMRTQNTIYCKVKTQATLIILLCKSKTYS